MNKKQLKEKSILSQDLEEDFWNQEYNIYADIAQLVERRFRKA